MEKVLKALILYTHTHTHTHTQDDLEKGTFSSIFTLKNNLINRFISRVNLFMYFISFCNFNT